MAKAEALEFDQRAHVYRLNGLIVPNVTRVLETVDDTYKQIHPHVLGYAQALGTAVHEATALDDAADLDEDSLAYEVVPYLDAWRKFRSERCLRLTAIEHRVYHPRHRYAGTLDRIGEIEGFEPPTLADIKSGMVTDMVGPQTAAYAEAFNYRSGLKVRSRCAVQLKNDGTYRIHPCRDKEDFSVFLAALTITNWRSKHGK